MGLDYEVEIKLKGKYIIFLLFRFRWAKQWGI